MSRSEKIQERLDVKIERLLKFAEKETKEDVCIAFSGGIDSSLLLKIFCEAALNNGTKVYAVTFQTFLHPMGDLEIAKRVAKEMGARHYVLQINELENQEILENPVERCYLCKKFLFSKLIDFAKEYEIATIIEGTNIDDLAVYRPGIRAVRELGIKSPLADCEFSKKEVRNYAAELGVSVANRPSTPCMATRLPYHTKIVPEILLAIDRGEQYLKKLGFKNVRLRLHQDITRIEVDEADMEVLLFRRKEIITHLRTLGFQYITMDVEGFRQGSMDEYLDWDTVKKFSAFE